MSIDEPDAKATWNPFGNRFSPMSQVHFCLLYSIRKAIIILGFRPPKWFLFSSRIRLQAWRWGKKKTLCSFSSDLHRFRASFLLPSSLIKVNVFKKKERKLLKLLFFSSDLLRTTRFNQFDAETSVEFSTWTWLMVDGLCFKLLYFFNNLTTQSSDRCWTTFFPSHFPKKGGWCRQGEQLEGASKVRAVCLWLVRSPVFYFYLFRFSFKKGKNSRFNRDLIDPCFMFGFFLAFIPFIIFLFLLLWNVQDNFTTRI